MSDYWNTSLQELFEEYGLKKNEKLFKDIAFISEMESEACGRHFIPNPIDSEIEDLKREIEKLKENHRHQISGVLKGVAERRNVLESDVSIDKDGLITYYK